ncbi:MAG: helix-turn-helix domain-containing protein [Magnetovibrio sp.]|nr:helix-turn-helix domain-containing protein [Magnetovibrio sp.]
METQLATGLRVPPNTKPDLDIQLATRLKALRITLGISAATMDRDAGFNVGTIGRLERGDQRIYAIHLYRVCQLTGLALEYFYSSSGHYENTKFTTADELERHELMLNFMRIKKPTLRHDLLELIQSLSPPD